jgi:outer membrane protein OmpA-like peptidoglycan-associated protein
VATLPDGSAVPVLAVFDADRISLDGQVRSQAAKELLESLVLANSRNPKAAVVNRLTINPNVPAGVGVRVIELTSSRFGEGKADVVGAHAAEIDRVATVLTALPEVSVLVIGHADQRGQNDKNYVLSLDRAQAVVDYLVLKGISPTRLSVRAVGEADLLTLNDDDTALALNRRTEFVFYGLLVDA